MYIDFKLEYDKVRDESALIDRLFKIYSKKCEIAAQTNSNFS